MWFVLWCSMLPGNGEKTEELFLTSNCVAKYLLNDLIPAFSGDLCPHFGTALLFCGLKDGKVLIHGLTVIPISQSEPQEVQALQQFSQHNQTHAVHVEKRHTRLRCHLANSVVPVLLEQLVETHRAVELFYSIRFSDIAGIGKDKLPVLKGVSYCSHICIPISPMLGKVHRRHPGRISGNQSGQYP